MLYMFMLLLVYAVIVHVVCPPTERMSAARQPSSAREPLALFVERRRVHYFVAKRKQAHERQRRQQTSKKHLSMNELFSVTTRKQQTERVTATCVPRHVARE